MKLLSLNCNQCGAPLEAPQKAKSVVCTFCEARLAVKQTASAFYTESLEHVEAPTQTIQNDAEEIRVQKELLRIDREWDEQREGFVRRDQHGNIRVPSRSDAISIGVGVAIGSLAVIAMAFIPGVPGAFALFGLAAVAAGAVFVVAVWGNVKKYEEKRDAYQRRRQVILDKLRSIEGPGILHTR